MADTTITPFVIVSAARSGTWHLVETLDQHPLVVCNGEPLNPKDESWPHAYLDTDALLALGFAGEICRTPKVTRPRAAGFKVLRENLEPPEHAGRLRRILDRPGMRVVILRRENLLEALRSRTQASVDWHWKQLVPPDEPPPLVQLAVDNCRAYFEDTERFFAEARMLTRRMLTIELTYEQLVANEPAALASVFELLGVPPLPSIAPVVFKQEHRGLDETVINYAELWEAFRDTPYARFFASRPSE